MARLRPRELWRAAGDDPLFSLFLVTVALTLLRARDLPGLDVGQARVVPSDVALAALLAGIATRLSRARDAARSSRSLAAAAAAFGLWILVTALPNGSDAIIGATKLVELGVLALAAIVVLDRPERVRTFLVVLVAFTVAAVAWAVVGFVERPGARQASFTGEHDLAALSTLALALGFAGLHERAHRLGRLPLVAGIAGAIGISLGAALASLLGLYLAVVAIGVAAATRRALTRQATVAMLLVTAAVTASTLTLRSGELGFLGQWFGPAPEEPGQYAASWSQRLVYAYVGTRVFIDHPVVGTGWYPLLPPKEFARYLPDARRRFSDQPARYFPAADAAYVPQQAYDQVLYELGAVGAALLLATGVAAASRAAVATRGWPSGDPDAYVSYLPAAWLAALVGTLAGAALFGGTPIAALFWLTLGAVGGIAALAPLRAGSARARVGAVAAVP